ISFTPADGVGGIRMIYARVYENGLLRREIALTKYLAPGPIRPGKPGRPRLVRHGTTLEAGWRAAGGPARDPAPIELGDGRRILIPAGTARTLKINGVAPGLDATATIGGLSANGTPGHTVRIRLPGHPRRQNDLDNGR